VRRAAHRGRVALRVALVLSLVSGCGGGGTRTSPTAAAPHRPPVAHRSVAPAVLTLRAALSKQFALAGSSSGGAVYDLTDHQQLFSLRDGIARPPASVEKLYTSVALLRALGPSATFQTSVLGSGFLSARGVWHGDLYLKGGGDPTFGDGGFNTVWEQGYGPTAGQLASQLRAAGVHRVTGHLIGDGSIFDDRPGPPSSGFAPDIADVGGELAGLTYDHGTTAPGWPTAPAFAAHELALTMKSDHVQVRAARSPGSAPSGARTLATVSSPTLSVLLKLMDVPSDDFLAEMLTKQLGVRAGRVARRRPGPP